MVVQITPWHPALMFDSNGNNKGDQIWIKGPPGAAGGCSRLRIISGMMQITAFAFENHVNISFCFLFYSSPFLTSWASVLINEFNRYGFQHESCWKLSQEYTWYYQQDPTYFAKWWTRHGIWTRRIIKGAESKVSLTWSLSGEMIVRTIHSHFSRSSAAREYPAWKKRLIILVITYASAMWDDLNNPLSVFGFNTGCLIGGQRELRSL